MQATTQLEHRGALHRSPRIEIRQVNRKPDASGQTDAKVLHDVHDKSQAALQFPLAGRDIHGGSDALIKSQDLHASLK